MRRGCSVQAPQHAGQRDEPHQHRQVDMHHQGDVEEVGHRQQPVDAGRARQHQQHREQARADQRRQAEPEPAARQFQAGVARHRDAVSGMPDWVAGSGNRGRADSGSDGQCAHDSVIPPCWASKSMTSTCAGFRVTVASRVCVKAGAGVVLQPHGDAMLAGRHLQALIDGRRAVARQPGRRGHMPVHRRAVQIDLDRHRRSFASALQRRAHVGRAAWPVPRACTAGSRRRAGRGG